MKRIIPFLLVLALILSGCSFDSNGFPVDFNTGNSTGRPLIVEIQGVTENNSLMTPAVDNVSMGLVVIDSAHNELHEGEFFGYTTVQNISGNGNVTFLLRTPPTAMLHFTYSISSDAEASLNIFENSTTSANGTLQTVFNHDRASNNTAQSTVYLTPNITALGTLISIDRWGAGKSAGGQGTAADEWMLAANTSYIIRITNETVSAQYASISLSWYRHT